MGAVVASFDVDTNQELKYGQRGEIRAVTPARMKGYYKNPETTKEFFYEDEEGRKWGCTGDIGYVDEDGDVFILGRASDGFYVEDNKWMYAFDVENVILQEQSVAACKVVKRDLNGTKVLVAHLVWNRDATQGEQKIASRLYQLCCIQLKVCAIPKYYKAHYALPVHSNGKQDNEALRKDVD